MEHEVRRALGGKGGKHKTHTHGVDYKRADNGGYTAHVHKHHGAGPHSEGHSHTEEHVLPDKEAMMDHLEQHMGDQPAAGEMEPPQEAQAEQGAAAGPGDAGAAQPGGM